MRHRYIRLHHFRSEDKARTRQGFPDRSVGDAGGDVRDGGDGVGDEADGRDTEEATSSSPGRGTH